MRERKRERNKEEMTEKEFNRVRKIKSEKLGEKTNEKDK